MHLKKLDSIQNQCMRVIGGFLRSTPVHVMECELHLQPLRIRRYYLAGKFLLKIRSFNGCEAIDVLNNLCQKPFWTRKKKPLLVTIYQSVISVPIQSSDVLRMFSLELWMSSMDLSSIIKTTIPFIERAKSSYSLNKLKLASDTYLNLEYSNYYQIYTDGSKHNNNTGAAFYDAQSKSGIKFKINCNISVMYTELIAILEALSYVHSLNNNNIVILTDSRGALQHLLRCTFGIPGIPIAYNIIDSVNKFNSNNRHVILQWVPAHAGIEYNERVDILAKEACFDGIDYTCLPYYTDLLVIIKKYCYKMWNEYFDERSKSKGIWFKTIQPSISTHIWFEDAEMNRLDIITALRLRSGHIPLNAFASLIGKIQSPNCVECGKIEDVYHIMAECLRNEPERILFCQTNQINLNEVGICNCILAFPVSSEAKRLYKIVQIGIKRRL